MTDRSHTTVLTDSRAAIKAFESGNIAREAASILEKRTDPGTHLISWFPAHMGADVHQHVPNLNELAHDRARDLTRRGGMEALWGQDEIQHNDPLLTFNEITSHYWLSRRAYPLPHPKLDRSQSITLRMLQTGSFPSRGLLSRISTDVDSSSPECNEIYCSLAHMLWQCPALPNGSLSSEADWEEALRNPSLQAQIQAIQRAQERAEHHGVPAPTWTRPAASAGPR